jgi:hypothetical protein
LLRFIPEQKIPAPVSRSAVTVPGSGIAVDLGALAREYMLEMLGDGASIGDGDGASRMGAGSAEVGAASTGSGDAGAGATGAGSGAATSAGAVSTEAGAGATGEGSGATGAGSGAACTLAAGDDSGCGSVGDCSVCGLGELSGELSAQGEEKFPGPHTSITAVAGGAAAR